MYTLRQNRPTTVIYIQVRRFAETYFLLCDEYDPVENVKSRILNMLEQTGFKLDRAEEPLTTDDLRLHLKRRVSILVTSAPISQLTNSCLNNETGSGQPGNVPRPASLQQHSPLALVQEAWH